MVEFVVRVFGDRALLATLVQQWAHEQVQLPRASALDGAAVLSTSPPYESYSIGGPNRSMRTSEAVCTSGHFCSQGLRIKCAVGFYAYGDARRDSKDDCIACPPLSQGAMGGTGRRLTNYHR